MKRFLPVLVLFAALPLGAQRLAPDNIPEIVSLLTREEKAALVVGARSTQFDGVGYTSLYVDGAASSRAGSAEKRNLILVI